MFKLVDWIFYRKFGSFLGRFWEFKRFLKFHSNKEYILEIHDFSLLSYDKLMFRV
jgi:hypothetical protein